MLFCISAGVYREATQLLKQVELSSNMQCNHRYCAYNSWTIETSGIHILSKLMNAYMRLMLFGECMQSQHCRASERRITDVATIDVGSPKFDGVSVLSHAQRGSFTQTSCFRVCMWRRSMTMVSAGMAQAAFLEFIGTCVCVCTCVGAVLQYACVCDVVSIVDSIVT